MHTTRVPWRRRTALLSAMAAGAIVLADVLFYRQPVGWTLGLYVALLLMAVTLRSSGYLRTWAGAVLAAAEVGLIIALVIEPTPMAVGLSMIGLVMIAATDRGGWTASVTRWFVRGVEFIVMALAGPIRDSRLAKRWARRRDTQAAADDRANPALAALLTAVRWLVPVLLTLVFIGLFAAANPLIERLVRSVRLDWLDVSAARIMLWLAAGAGTWSLLRTRWRREQRATATPSPAPPTLATRLWDRVAGAGLVVRCLILFNAVFAVQTVLDLIYLYGGAALPEGMTYAEYAHRGAYPLVVTALLAAGFVLAAFRPRGPADVSPLARRLVYLWLGQNVMLVASAAWRLGLYVDVYSLTRLRVAAAIWMLIVALGLIWIAWRILAGRDNRWLVRANVLTAAVVLYACALINFDGLIADFNVRHCREVRGEGVALDTDYLLDLGPEALPAVAWFEAHAPEASATGTNIHAVRSLLSHELAHRTRSWRGWTWRRHHLRALAL